MAYEAEFKTPSSEPHLETEQPQDAVRAIWELIFIHLQAIPHASVSFQNAVQGAVPFSRYLLRNLSNKQHFEETIKCAAVTPRLVVDWSQKQTAQELYQRVLSAGSYEVLHDSWDLEDEQEQVIIHEESLRSFLLGGIQLLGVRVGSFNPSVNWMGQHLLRVNILDETLEVQFFRYNMTDLPEHFQDFVNVPPEHSHDYAQFLYMQCREFQVSRMFKISIPLSSIYRLLCCGAARGQGLLIVDIKEPPHLLKRRVFVSAKIKNEWRPRSDWTSDSQLSSCSRYYFLSQSDVFGQLVQLMCLVRPDLEQLLEEGISDAHSTTNVSFETAQRLARTCSHCLRKKPEVSRLGLCTGCRDAWYCSVRCQKLHRKKHKKLCLKLATELQSAQLSQSSLQNQTEESTASIEQLVFQSSEEKYEDEQKTLPERTSSESVFKRINPDSSNEPTNQIIQVLKQCNVISDSSEWRSLDICFLEFLKRTKRPRDVKSALQNVMECNCCQEQVLIASLLKDQVCPHCRNGIYFSFCFGRIASLNDDSHCSLCGYCFDWHYWHCFQCNRCSYGESIIECEWCGAHQNSYFDEASCVQKPKLKPMVDSMFQVADTRSINYDDDPIHISDASDDDIPEWHRLAEGGNEGVDTINQWMQLLTTANNTVS